MNNALNVCLVPSPESFQISDCVSATSLTGLSAIDEFEISLLALNRTAAAMTAMEHPDVVAQMLIVSVVSATETFFKRLFASLVTSCPLTAENVGRTQIPYHAVRLYPQEVTALALLEGVLFSSRGVIASELKRFTLYDLKHDATLSGAVSAFDEVCIVRHSAAHWRGFLDSKSMAKLSLNVLGETVYRLDLSLNLVQRAYAVCDYLVRVVNDRIFHHTIQKWLDRGLIVLDVGTEQDDLNRCQSLLSVFGSGVYCAARKIDPETLRKSMISDLLAPR